MKILSLIEAFDPAPSGGGPVTALRNLILNGPDEWEHWVFTRNTDYGSSLPVEVEVDRWVRRSGTRVPRRSDFVYGITYATPHHLKRKLLEAIEAVHLDAVYLHGAYAPLTRLYLRLRKRHPELREIPVVITPHGNLSPAVLKHHAFRKQAWIRGAKLLKLYESVRWHAASEREADQIRAVFAQDAEMVVCGHVLENRSGIGPQFRSRCSEVPSTGSGQSGTTSPTVLITPARISPEKNLLWGLKLLQSCTIPIHWRIVGPGIDSRYGKTLRKQAQKNPEHLRVEFLSPVSPEVLSGLYGESNALFLPSLSENYSFVIPEAWSHGLPVLISDQTPWQDLGEKGLGWDLPLTDPDGWRGVLKTLQDDPPNPESILEFAGKLGKESREKIWGVFGERNRSGTRPEFRI